MNLPASLDEQLRARGEAIARGRAIQRKAETVAREAAWKRLLAAERGAPAVIGDPAELVDIEGFRDAC